MKQSVCMMALVLLSLASGCQKDDMAGAVREGIKQIEIPKGSVVQYAEVPRGTAFLPGKALTTAKPTTFPTDGYILFIDEQPNYNWQHSFQLVFVPNPSGKPEVFFRGSAIPDYTLKKPDGSAVTGWKKR